MRIKMNFTFKTTINSMKRTYLLILFFVSLLSSQQIAFSQIKTATIRIDDKLTHQRITGFGGFVNSPQFAYGHMSTAEIKKIWGRDSETGYNIMRIFISDNENSWPQALTTAKLAKELGLILFASPWSMPAAWKTNNSTAGKTQDGTIGYLKEENYADYAAFLNRFVSYLRTNGVELDAISIQNEPDYDVTYSGCHWTPGQIAKFLKEHRSSIDCKIMAPETVGLSTESYVNALIADDVVDKFDIYAGHQYGGTGNAHKKFVEKGKEIWQSEYLINWNANASVAARNFDWSIDAFDFAGAINICMLSDVNAWVHYASKRYYGMLGDGEYGTRNRVITKRGYILSHYAKYVTGTTRITDAWSDDSGILDGSSYLSVTGDSIIVVVINPSDNDYLLTVDLPFYSTTGKKITTTEIINLFETDILLNEESCRPRVTIDASSVTTLVFTKNNERPVSQMTGEAVRDKMEDQMVVGAVTYQVSGKTATLKHDSPLLSANRTSNNSYLKLKEQFNRLVFRVERLSSTMNYTSANTTLHYINGNGEVKSHNYGEFIFDKRTDFDWVFDISRNVLTDGCTGILSITNGNYSSILTFWFGDVYFTVGSEKMYKFSGIYSRGDSDLLDCLDNKDYTSLDFTEVVDIDVNIDWNELAANKNGVYYVDGSLASNQNNRNVIVGSVCNDLVLTDEGGNFYPVIDFTANNATYHCALNGYRMIVLPFEANIPDGVLAYELSILATEVKGILITNEKIPANTPVLVRGSGRFSFNGTGRVSSLRSLNVNETNGVYIGMRVPAGSYYLNNDVFQLVTSDADVNIDAFCAYLTPEFVTADILTLKIDGETSIGQIKDMPIVLSEEYYSLTGQRVNSGSGRLQGIYIVKSFLSDGTVTSRKIYLK